MFAPRPTGLTAGEDGGWGWALRTAAVPWLVARVVVAVALVVARELNARVRLPAAVSGRIHEGLLGWDAGWYESIARHGYWGAGHDSLRFYPLVPALTRGLAEIPGVSVGAALLVVANLSALGAMTVLVVLGRHETGDPAVGRRAAWFFALAPPAFVLVMGYAEGTLALLGISAMLALRRQRWWWAALFGLLAGATRPLGVFLALAAAVEAGRGWRRLQRQPRVDLVGRVAAVAAPVVGAGAFLAWVGWRYHDALAPLRIQQQGGHRGSVTDPLSTLLHDARDLVHGQHIGQALHLPWVLLAVALLIVCARSWPASYTVLAAAVLAAALTAANLDGFERYALSAFPLVLAAAGFVRHPLLERAVLVIAAAGLVGYALLAFTNLYVP